MDNRLPHLASGKTFLTFENDVQQENISVHCVKFDTVLIK